MNDITNEKWYALFVATGEEDKVKERIYYRIKDELRAVVPKRNIRERKEGKWADNIRIIFPGYVLLNGQINSNNYSLIRDIPGVINLLKDSNGPQEIREHEIELISRLTYNNEIIGRSNIYVQGGQIIVIDGPLLGLEGYIQTIDKRKGRVKVLLNLMGEPRTVELSVEMVQTA
ncbi:MAG: antiterminator LoaP [Clostridiaceae bacterium]|nr:antiterminator LoaP [Clostridiaceae bacterium]